jgi:hypothetical protein
LKTSFRRVRDEIRQKVREFTSQKIQGLSTQAAAAGAKS